MTSCINRFDLQVFNVPTSLSLKMSKNWNEWKWGCKSLFINSWKVSFLGKYKHGLFGEHTFLCQWVSVNSSRWSLDCHWSPGQPLASLNDFIIFHDLGLDLQCWANGFAFREKGLKMLLKSWLFAPFILLLGFISFTRIGVFIEISCKIS